MPPKILLTSCSGLILLVSINLSYTGCAVYPVKQTCLEDKLEWSLSKNHVEKMSNWYQQWSKAGAGVNYRVENPDEYIKDFNWVANWFERYFLYKFKETLLGVSFLIIFIYILYYLNNIRSKIETIKIDKLSKKSIKIISLITTILFIWFFKHPTLRYGGYYLLVTLIFIPVALLLARKRLFLKKNYLITILLIILSYSLFNIKNLNRIKDELRIVKNNNFPFFYSPNQSYEKRNIGKGVDVFIPKDFSGCWAIKTPCALSEKHISGRKLGKYKVIYNKNKLKN